MKITKKVKIVSLMTVLIFIAASFSGCGKSPEIKKMPKNVKTLDAVLSSINVSVDYGGKLKPMEEVLVAAKTPGKVEAVMADIGSEVKEGDILFTLDSKDFEAQNKQAKASLEAAQANYTRTADSAVEQQVIQAEAAVKQAGVQFYDAKNFYEKTQDLYNAGSISKQEFDNAKSRYDNASIALETSKKNLELIRGKAAEQAKNAAFAQVDQAKAAVELSALQLDNTKVASPVSGIVSVRNVDPGEMIAAGSPVYTVINIRQLIVEISITDKMLGKVKKGDKVKVSVNAKENSSYEGIIDSISPSVDSRTQLYTVKVKVDNNNMELRPGMFVKVALPLESKENLLTVPEGGIVVESGIQYVYAVVDDKVRKIPVETGISDGKTVEILNGIKAGEKIIMEGQVFLHDGEAVKLVK